MFKPRPRRHLADWRLPDYDGLRRPQDASAKDASAKDASCEMTTGAMKTVTTRLDAAIWGGFAVFATSSVVTPVCLPEISRSLSAGLSGGGAMETARTCVFPVVLILAGLSAHRWGKKRFIASGQFLIAAGMLAASFAQNYVMLVAALMLTGVGGALTEALLNPLVVDLHPDDSGRFLNMTNACYSAGVMASAFVFGEMLTLGYSWRTMYRIAAAAALAVGVAFSVSGFPPAIGDESRALRAIRRTLALPGFWLFAAAIFLGAGVESAFTFWSRSYVDTYLGGVPRAGALAVVIFAGAMAAGRLLASRLSGKLGLKPMMMASAALGLVTCTVLPLGSGLLWFYALVALAGVATACFWPSVLAEAAGCLDAPPVMLFVLLSCAGISGFGLTPWAMGMIGDAAGLRAAFAVMPGYFVALIVVLGIEWRMTHKPPAAPPTPPAD